jgi:hypothetical protein
MLRVGPAGFKLEMISNLLRTVDGHEARLQRTGRMCAPAIVSASLAIGCAMQRWQWHRGVESSQRYGGRRRRGGHSRIFFPAAHAQARIPPLDSQPVAPPSLSRDVQPARSPRRAHACFATNRSQQPLRSNLINPPRGQIPIAPAAPTPPPSSDFVPWRFSDAGHRSAWLASSSPA